MSPPCGRLYAEAKLVYEHPVPVLSRYISVHVLRLAPPKVATARTSALDSDRTAGGYTSGHQGTGATDLERDRVGHRGVDWLVGLASEGWWWCTSRCCADDECLRPRRELKVDSRYSSAACSYESSRAKRGGGVDIHQHRCADLPLMMMLLLLLLLLSLLLLLTGVLPSTLVFGLEVRDHLCGVGHQLCALLPCGLPEWVSLPLDEVLGASAGSSPIDHTRDLELLHPVLT